ncbi:MAG: peptide methionine sulfoxide reductase MsrB [Bacteroidota bacterium]|nr:peptide methionine sulfoxide reductase MsrB [Bacteroidota bacterium]
MKGAISILIALGLMLASCGQQKSNIQKTEIQKQTGMNTNNDDSGKVVKTDEDWKKFLTPEQYHVLREKGTESPFTGKYYLNKEKGVYVCGACGNELFTSDMKFDSHCGWPSFDKEIAGGKIKTVVDTSFGMVRTEILCGKCGSHLGHLFNDGPTESGMRYCVNSLSLDFKKEDNK